MRTFSIDLLLATALIGAAVLLSGPRFDAGGSWQLAADAANPADVESAALRLEPNGHFDLEVERTGQPAWRRHGTWVALPHGFELHALPFGMARIPASHTAIKARAADDGTVVFQVEGRELHLRRGTPGGDAAATGDLLRPQIGGSRPGPASVSIPLPRGS